MYKYWSQPPPPSQPNSWVSLLEDGGGDGGWKRTYSEHSVSREQLEQNNHNVKISVEISFKSEDKL